MLGDRRYWIDRRHAELHSCFLRRAWHPGELHSFPFETFEQARNDALDCARTSEMSFDYLLFTDADMEFEVQNQDFLQELTLAAYLVVQRSGVTYWNIRLLRRDAPARFKGVTHEYLDVRAGETKAIEGISFVDHRSGANRGGKYERATRLLPKAIATESDPRLIARYTFYLANALRDGGRKEAALETYLKRAGLGHWQQEVFLSLLYAAELKQALQYPDEDIIAAYVRATASCATRAEALYGAACFCRSKGLPERGYQFAAAGAVIRHPRRGLFVRDWVYHYALLDELAQNAHAIGRYAECAKACDRLLSEGKLPAAMRDRVVRNEQLALEKLKSAQAASDPSYGVSDQR